MTGTDIRNIVKTEIRTEIKNRFMINIPYSNGYLEKDFTDEFIDFVIKKYQDKIIEALVTGNNIGIRNFMSFYISDSKRKLFRNPKTGQSFMGESKKKIKVRIGKKLMDLLNWE